MKQIDSKTAIIRELHVYGKALNLGEKDMVSAQHTGFGKALIQEAEKIAVNDFDSKKMVIISGLGVREYYRKNFEYTNDGPFVSKKLV